MPKRTDIQTILLLGAGPIVIGQACEFDYSGTQACKALREEGYRVVLVNSNPATIMTDPQIADATYIEPMNWEVIARIIEREKPDAILPTMGGQTALNVALDLAREGILAKHNVEMIGATREAIDKAEDRELFRDAMQKIGLEMPHSKLAHSLEDALEILDEMGFPIIIRPSFTMGGSGGGIAYNRDEFIEICERGLDLSPTNELLLDESIIGWKEYEMEVVRDRNDNCIIVCSIENFDPMGIHTGDSITVAPAQTLTDKEYQRMRDASIAVLREIGVDTGGSNVQFGLDPKTGRMVVIEMNPRVSRSSALASKATGFPIARVAAKLAIGYTLDELSNEITGGKTPASFEPAIDYVVTKIPRFNFEKFQGADTRLTTQMKSVGEVMAIGRTFQESLQKALRGLEVGNFGLESIVDFDAEDTRDILCRELRIAGWNRIWYLADAFRSGMSLEEIQLITHIDPWFLAQLEDLIREEERISNLSLADLSAETLWHIKRKGFADARIAHLLGVSEQEVRKHRLSLGIKPVYKRVDTCAAEFSTDTAYLYSTYETECEAQPTQREKIMILGGGPNRIGQGIEFDYCCVHAALAMREAGYETIMVNCNPETISTDYDISDRLYFESLTLEDVLNIVELENPKGVIVQYGGQTPLKLSKALEAAGVPIIGTSPDAIDRAESRERFAQLVNKLGILQPPNGTVRSVEEGLRLANVFAYPLVVRPSYVLGGRAMKVVYNEKELQRYMHAASEVSAESPLLLDHFVDDATEVDVDIVCDGKNILLGGIMEHIEQAGIHSGDSACCLPPHSLSPKIQEKLLEQMKNMALELGVVGLMNAQFALRGELIYVLEVNPRASRTVPFVAKATGVPLAKIAAKCMMGQSLIDQGFTEAAVPTHYSVKFPVFPFAKFPGVDPMLGPEMKSTGEVMGIGSSFEEAFAKGLLGAGITMPTSGLAFISVRNADKPRAVEVSRYLCAMGFDIIATRGTAAVLAKAGVPHQVVNKVTEGRPNIVDLIKNNEIAMIINTTEGQQAYGDSYAIRSNAVSRKVCYFTTLEGGKAASASLQYDPRKTITRLQDLG
jgi:carbamoyl-phosphate synthase large subunit